MPSRDHTFINGRWAAPSGARVAVVDPSTAEIAGSFTAATPADVDAAVSAARAALPAWSQRPVGERVGYLVSIADDLVRRQEEFARLIGTEMGAPLKLATAVHTGLPITVLRSHVELAAEIRFEASVSNSTVLKEPVGVVAAIAPWNFPLHQIIAKLAPALTAGCTIVVKPSVEASLSAYLLAELIEASDLPAGVFNLVTGAGSEVGEALVTHHGVDLISFTGSTSAGRHIGQLAADRVKPVILELGGKSANVILDDADLRMAVKVGIANAFMNSGQACTAWSRMLVPRRRTDDVIDLCREITANYRVGMPQDPATRLGPLVSERQLRSVTEHIDSAIGEGHTLVTGGTGLPEGLTAGYFVKPTIFAHVPPTSRLAQEEVFGPVLAVIDYADEEEALQIANDSIYGLAGAVWSGDLDRASRFARRMQTGQVDINGGRFNPLAPFGGYKQSGIGREFGTYGIEEYLRVKSVQV